MLEKINQPFTRTLNTLQKKSHNGFGIDAVNWRLSKSADYNEANQNIMIIQATNNRSY